jgi:hypothetical protein
MSGERTPDGREIEKPEIKKIPGPKPEVKKGGEIPGKEIPGIPEAKPESPGIDHIDDLPEAEDDPNRPSE